MLQLLRKITVGQEQIIEKFYRCLNCVVLAGEHGQREELTAMQNTKQGGGGFEVLSYLPNDSHINIVQFKSSTININGT